MKAATAEKILSNDNDLRSEMNDATIDGNAERGEFAFVFGLDVIDGIIGVEIKGDVIDGEIEQLKLLERIIEERAVIGFEMQLTVGFDDASILVEEIDIGETALGMLIPRPRIAEIDIDAVDGMLDENLIDVGDIEDGEPDVMKVEVANLTSGGVENGSLRLEAEEIYIGILMSDGGNEIALAGAELDVKFFIADSD